jgi:hypothetical protein
MSKFAAILIGSVALLAAVPATAQQAPADKYTLTLIIEAADGTQLHKETRACDALTWCDGEAKTLAVAGKPRLFAFKTRWYGPLAGPQLNVSALAKEARFNDTGAGTDTMPFRPGAKWELLVYDTPTGHSWKGQKDFERGPVARMRAEIRY